VIERLDAQLQARTAADVLEEFDWLGAAIDADASAGRFDAWGLSSVVDENVGAPVLPRAVFDALHARAEIPSIWPVGNAGLLHVYGYLLSTTPTPYGLKRDRWLDGILARECGLPVDAFVPWVGERTLLDRVTEVLSDLLDHSVARRETVVGATGLIAMSATRGPAALGYALERDAGERRLITMFPVSDADAVLRQIAAESPRLRWNAVSGG
jgi:hypothetical protein